VVIEGPAGAETVRTPWLLASDGPDSAVRDALGLRLQGEPHDHRWLLADVDLDDRGADRRVTIVPADSGAVSLVPLGSSRWQVVADLGPADAAANGGATAADVQRVLDERTALGWHVAAARWVSDLRINERQVERYVAGRVLLL